MRLHSSLDTERDRAAPRFPSCAGISCSGPGPALIAALVIGLLNATVGLFLKIITFPISILTLGIFLLVINGVMILVACALFPGSMCMGLYRPSGARWCWRCWAC